VKLVAVGPALAFVIAVSAAAAVESPAAPLAVAIVCTVAAWIAWLRAADRWAGALLLGGFCAAGLALGADAHRRALNSTLRAVLDREPGGFALDAPGPGMRHDPIAVRVRLLEDASPAADVTRLRGRVLQLFREDGWIDAGGDVAFTVGGRPDAAALAAWRAGRTIRTFATFRRPAVYLDEGVPDFEQRLAFDGTTLFGSVKSGLLITVEDRGGPIDEAAAGIRAAVRERLARHVGIHDPISAAVVTAILIGDRGALPDETRDRLQEAGTYHVIAISGGNIAILAGLVVGILLLCGASGRAAALGACVVLLGYAQVVASGASVWRATTMAVVYLGARTIDHRSPPWQSMACAAVIVVAVRPLDVRDVGFVLTFMATAALIEAARRIATARVAARSAQWLFASLVASAAAELALLPVSATSFSRVTAAGLVLNLAAVPLMVMVQVSGMAVAMFDEIELVAVASGWVAHWSTQALLGSARLVDVAPWLSVRVPPPHVALVVVYYAAVTGALLASGGTRRIGLVSWAVAAVAIVTGQPESWIRAARIGPAFRVIAFDVGQGDSTLVEFPDRSTLLVDTGGIPFGGGAFDMGERVLAPALWHRGIRRLDRMLLTHGDPDHIGGAASLIDAFSPRELWTGIPVPTHMPMTALLMQAADRKMSVKEQRTGNTWGAAGVSVRVLHPPAPDWERPRVRNDDSVVLEIRYGDVAVLMTGDVGASVERSLIPQLQPAAVRILKAGHHGSRTSTSQELLDAWRPQIAIISAGRGNTFGHPAPEVVRRLEATGARIYRTDRDGQVTVESDGRVVSVKTFKGEDR
jgi:competence protein ComEC